MVKATHFAIAIGSRFTAQLSHWERVCVVLLKSLRHNTSYRSSSFLKINAAYVC
jgi:hypothetical protein